ncbi:uncharacterized protein EI97DRAFT_448670 [Westerdykella ornata]|uniref:Pyoverdine/dityrosine biosynthesis protein n=1 Tax=Westerdykella ornata TaxID=318751 RepID=A0A6A6JRF5_WESOR|nr:uncharacterized protein EI97DRAFT_448670 [Westerdykella ornata]KAF2278854.1 hypothetical protein EI97DRAFT_448670 [Westerdykella ornata]
MNSGSSSYHHIQGIYCRSGKDELLGVEGRNADQIIRHWPTLRTQRIANQSKTTKLPSGIEVVLTPIELPDFTTLESSLSLNLQTQKYTVREIYHQSKGCYIGLLSAEASSISEEESAFTDWIETFFLLETSLWPYSDSENVQNIKAVRTSEAITTLFETLLRNISSDDQWHIGKDGFIRRVLGFVARNEKIQMAIPAFPCKSPNTRKVGGRNPDMAEKIALDTLHTFAKAVRGIYPPGVAMWVISDGHVFSDCIGVDDDEVSAYDKKLHDLYKSLYNTPEDQEAIRFRGLTDMFFSNPDIANTFPHSYIQNFEIAHPIESKRSSEAETARQIMMAGCQSSREHFQKLIADQHPATLSLYRGQARFMQDDLATPEFLAKSAKQKKKISFAVATEMIARNQAYSNLLELLLPNYVRLSIHAHNNRGPKYAICLFPRDKIRAIDSVKKRHELVPAYEFQVPTPWHNSAIKVAGDDIIYIGKAEIVKAAIEAGDFEGGWVEGPEGGHFALRSTQPAVELDCRSGQPREDSDQRADGGSGQRQ